MAKILTYNDKNDPMMRANFTAMPQIHGSAETTNDDKFATDFLNFRVYYDFTFGIQKFKRGYFMKAFRQSSFLSLLIIVLVLSNISVTQVNAQRRKPIVKKIAKPVSSSTGVAPSDTTPVDKEKVLQSMGVVCSERTRDPLSSTPIDVMQSRPSVSLNHPDSQAGITRARRLLPTTREFVIKAIQELGKKYNIEQWRINLATKRIQKVTRVKPDPDLRDNASVTLSEPDAISFGTIFLVGLPSDEGMISVLSHEMTHLADGRQNTLQPLFRAIGGRATAVLGMRVVGQKSEELTCDLIGVMVARYLIERIPNKDTLVRRLARSLQHNCVNDDDTDEDHLSPRTTMRAVISLDQRLINDLLGTTTTTKNQSYRNDFFFNLSSGTSLTISRSDSNQPH